jgi:hypothetical protein
VERTEGRRQVALPEDQVSSEMAFVQARSVARFWIGLGTVFGSVGLHQFLGKSRWVRLSSAQSALLTLLVNGNRRYRGACPPFMERRPFILPKKEFSDFSAMRDAAWLKRTPETNQSQFEDFCAPGGWLGPWCSKRMSRLACVLRFNG